MPTSPVGRTLGKYEILAEIGRGGMGTVYLAHDPLLDRRVAVKVLAPHLIWEKGFVERFLREARAAARLKHPNIVTIHDVGHDGDHYYFVMEYLEGHALTDLIRLQGPQAIPQVLAILRPLADALEYAHRQGVIHRDIKPGNVIVGPAGQVTLTDFGIARAAQETRLTATGTIVGTPEYMSPEQARGEEVDARTDIYSLAILAYELLSGRTPFGGTTPHAVLHQQIYEPPPSIGQARPDLPPTIETVLEQALAKEPGRRHQTPAAFVDALELALTAQGIAARMPQAPTAASIKPTTPPSPARTSAKQAAAPPGVSAGRQPQKPSGRPPATSRSRRLPGWIWLLGGLAAVALITAGVLLFAFDGGGGPVSTPRPTEAVHTEAPKPQPTPSNTSKPAPTTRPATREFECPDPLGCVHFAPDEPIRIGTMFALSGAAPAAGIDSSRGVEIAVGDRPQILGHPIEVIGEDSRCTEEGGLRAAERLAKAPKVVAVVGPTCSSAAWGAVPTLCNAALPVVSPSNTDPALTDPGRPGEWWCYLRTAWNSGDQSIAAARFVRDVGLSRVAAVHDESRQAQQLLEALAVELERLGGTITAAEPLPPGDAELEELLHHVSVTAPDLLYLPLSFEPAQRVIRKVREMPQFEQIRLLGTSDLFGPELLGALGQAAVGLLMTAPDVPTRGPAYEELLAKYQERYGEPPIEIYHAYAYDAVMMVFAAIERVAVLEPDGTLHLGREALVGALLSTAEMEGITGILTCDGNGDCAGSHLAIYEVVSADPGSWHPAPGPDNANPRRIWP